MDYRIYSFEVNHQMKDLLLAELLEIGFDSFEEIQEGLDAYIPDDMVDDPKQIQIEAIAKKFQLAFQWKILENQNWNSIWEAGFQPVSIGEFCYIRPDFHPPKEGIRFDLVINPKMAFGTGHHETTLMMMSFMEKIDFSGKKVLDYGCGTGILGILAAKLQSNEVWAIDHDPHSVENAEENAAVNRVEHIHILEGDLDVVANKQFDLILANINKNVLLRSMRKLAELVTDNGLLLLSGILNSDLPIILEAAQTDGFEKVEHQLMGEWTALKLLKKATI
jgi:ribosomal protein L11 methyltransferase